MSGHSRPWLAIYSGDELQPHTVFCLCVLVSLVEEFLEGLTLSWFLPL